MALAAGVSPSHLDSRNGYHRPSLENHLIRVRESVRWTLLKLTLLTISLTTAR